LPTIPSALNDEQTDILYRWLKDNEIYGPPADVLPDNRDRLVDELPEIFAKFFGKLGSGEQAA
jgi:hypothetical protein